jgi:hypothetical protein
MEGVEAIKTNEVAEAIEEVDQVEAVGLQRNVGTFFPCH